MAFDTEHPDIAAALALLRAIPGGPDSEIVGVS